jgi:hypothetical protein
VAKRVIFTDRIVQYPERYGLTDLGGGTYEIIEAPGTVTSDGTAFTASVFNALSDEIIFKLNDTSTSTTAYTCSIDNFSAYYETLTILFKPANTNTGASTLNVSGVGAIAIKKVNNSGNIVDIVANDLIKNKYSTMTYNGTYFIMNNPSADLAQLITDMDSLETRLDTDETVLNAIKNETIKFAVSTGTANNYAANISSVASLYAGLSINLVINVANTGTSTLTVNSLASKTIKFNGVNVTAGMLPLNKLCHVIYNGVDFELQPTANQLSDLQAALNIHKTSSDHDGRYYTETELGATTSGSSGATKIGVTTISGLTGNNVQTCLQNLNANKNNIVDDTTGIEYKLGINNGLLYIKAV